MSLSHYAELSWPHVAALPRDIPLLIPLGIPESETETAARACGWRDAILLPAVPYGFFRSDRSPLALLRLPRALLRRVLRAIERSLTAQGFSRVRFLDPHAVSAQVDPSNLVFESAPAPASDHLAWQPDVGERVIVISTGHTEQHGYHLPTGTDTLIAEAIAAGVAAASDQAICLPTWPYGASTHTREFPATLNLGGRLFEDLFIAIVGCLVERGARRILFSNAHGGNHSHLVNVVKVAGERWPEAFTAVEFLHTTGPALERHRQSGRGGLGHGCELETSYLLHLCPDLVDMTQATTETDFIATPNYYMDWIEGGRLIANPPWSDDTTSGIYGDATLATAEKGAAWLEAAIQQKLESIREVEEQHRRRVSRRHQRGQT